MLAGAFRRRQACRLERSFNDSAWTRGPSAAMRTAVVLNWQRLRESGRRNTGLDPPSCPPPHRDRPLMHRELCTYGCLRTASPRIAPSGFRQGGSGGKPSIARTDVNERR